MRCSGGFAVDVVVVVSLNGTDLATGYTVASTQMQSCAKLLLQELVHVNTLSICKGNPAEAISFVKRCYHTST